MTQHFATRQLRFFLTAPSPCPYLPERFERKVFAHLPLSDGATVNDSLSFLDFHKQKPNAPVKIAAEQADADASGIIMRKNNPALKAAIEDSEARIAALERESRQ